ncbi:MAG: HlyD family efflux transporter periplasmic adaptor subunit [Algisphaera sp.]
MSNTQQMAANDRAAETSALMQRLLRFQGPPEQFLGELLHTQCRLGQAVAGSVVRLSQSEPQSQGDPQSQGEGRTEHEATVPDMQGPPEEAQGIAGDSAFEPIDPSFDVENDETQGFDRTSSSESKEQGETESFEMLSESDGGDVGVLDAGLDVETDGQAVLEAMDDGAGKGPEAELEQASEADGEGFTVNLMDSMETSPEEAASPVQAEVMAIYPPAPSTGVVPSWLSHAIELALQFPGGGSHVHRLEVAEPVEGGPRAHHLIVVPVQTEHGFQGIQAFLIETDEDSTVQNRRQRLELSVSLLSLYEMRQVLQKRESDLRGLSTATRVLSAGNDHARFKGASMALCNEFASRWRAERVSVGLLAGRYVKMKAMSQTERLSRKMEMVQDIEAAMEECLDQDVEVMHPASPDTTAVNRAAGELSTKHGPSTVCSLPLRRGEETVGVVTLERGVDDPFSLEEISFLRMACDLITPRLVELGDHDQWFGARWARSARRGGATLVGAKHTWAKLTAVALLVGAVAMVVVPGTIRVEAPFKFQAVTQRSIPAPFDGYLQTVEVEPNDVVEAGDVLATLDTAELRAKRARLDAEQIGYEKEAARAAREDKQVERQIAEAQRDNVSAQLDWIDWQIEHAVIRSPIGGTVVVGDLKQKLGAPSSKGDVLFEVAPLTELRAELLVDDDKISDIPGVGAKGRLAAAAQPDEKLSFDVEVIHPVAEVVDGRNVFRVRVKLNETRSWARPGIEGVAKIDSHKAPIGWVWTREAVNWVRMKLWI